MGESTQVSGAEKKNMTYWPSLMPIDHLTAVNSRTCINQSSFTSTTVDSIFVFKTGRTTASNSENGFDNNESNECVDSVTDGNYKKNLNFFGRVSETLTIKEQFYKHNYIHTYVQVYSANVVCRCSKLLGARSWFTLFLLRYFLFQSKALKICFFLFFKNIWHHPQIL